tara:strand:+ start:193 stop:546 length:354 start_codon:yes stop_codon:yes gene_type:complete
MLKKALSLVAVSVLSTPAFAGFYVNVENNASFLKTDYQSNNTDLHIGYEGGNDNASWYIQGGGLFQSVDGLDSETNISAKTGGSVSINDRVSVYGELSGVFDNSNSYGTKIGTKIKL